MSKPGFCSRATARASPDAEIDLRFQARRAEVAHGEVPIVPGHVRAEHPSIVLHGAGEPQRRIPVARAQLQHPVRADAVGEQAEQRSPSAARRWGNVSVRRVLPSRPARDLAARQGRRCTARCADPRSCPMIRHRRPFAQWEKSRGRAARRTHATTLTLFGRVVFCTLAEKEVLTMKRILCTAFVVLVAFSSMNAFAQIKGLPDLKGRTVRAVTGNDFTPLNFVDPKTGKRRWAGSTMR